MARDESQGGRITHSRKREVIGRVMIKFFFGAGENVSRAAGALRTPRLAWPRR